MRHSLIDKVNGRWIALDRLGERLVRKTQGERFDAERVRKHDVILQILFEEARLGRVYTASQFAEAFEKASLGGNTVIRERLSVLATKGFIKFFRDAKEYGLPPPGRSRFGYLCVEGMELGTAERSVDPDTGEVTETAPLPVRPTHYKCPQDRRRARRREPCRMGLSA
jgi:putative DNA primase/helicase